jgi:hypothetical protein
VYHRTAQAVDLEELQVQGILLETAQCSHFQDLLPIFVACGTYIRLNKQETRWAGQSQTACTLPAAASHVPCNSLQLYLCVTWCCRRQSIIVRRIPKCRSVPRKHEKEQKEAFELGGWWPGLLL